MVHRGSSGIKLSILEITHWLRLRALWFKCRYGGRTKNNRGMRVPGRHGTPGSPVMGRTVHLDVFVTATFVRVAGSQWAFRGTEFNRICPRLTTSCLDHDEHPLRPFLTSSVSAQKNPSGEVPTRRGGCTPKRNTQ